MDQDTKNQLERHSNLADYFHETKPRWDSIPAVKKRVDAYLTRQAALPTPPPAVDRDDATTTGARRGATQDKADARTALIEQLPAVAASVHLWLTDPDNQPTDELAAATQRALAADIDIRQPSKLRNMATGALIGLAQRTLNGLALVPAADLPGYDLTPDDTAAFEKVAEQFGVRRNRPASAAREASLTAEELEQTLDDLDEYVLGELKKAVDTRRFKDPTFVSGFKRAYRLTDRSATRTASPTPGEGGTPTNG